MQLTIYHFVLFLSSFQPLSAIDTLPETPLMLPDSLVIVHVYVYAQLYINTT